MRYATECYDFSWVNIFREFVPWKLFDFETKVTNANETKHPRIVICTTSRLMWFHFRLKLDWTGGPDLPALHSVILLVIEVTEHRPGALVNILT